MNPTKKVKEVQRSFCFKCFFETFCLFLAVSWFFDIWCFYWLMISLWPVFYLKSIYKFKWDLEQRKNTAHSEGTSIWYFIKESKLSRMFTFVNPFETNSIELQLYILEKNSCSTKTKDLCCANMMYKHCKYQTRSISLEKYYF